MFSREQTATGQAWILKGRVGGSGGTQAPGAEAGMSQW